MNNIKTKFVNIFSSKSKLEEDPLIKLFRELQKRSGVYIDWERDLKCIQRDSTHLTITIKGPLAKALEEYAKQNGRTIEQETNDILAKFNFRRKEKICEEDLEKAEDQW